MLVIPDIARSSRRMMANLLRNQVRRSHLILPLPNKQFPKEWIQRLHPLLLSIFIFIAVLLLERTQEPFQY
jgi:hypothetical protein